MPVWHELTRRWREDGKLAVLGIVQEQHPRRSQLFAQWQQFDWPILWDPFNATGSQVVPRMILVDEHGIVRSLRPDPRRIEADFLNVDFPAPQTPAPVEGGQAHELPGVELADSDAERIWQVATSRLLWAEARATGERDAAIEALAHFAAEHPERGDAAFRRGVAQRLRYDSDSPRPGDFQAALDAWAWALEIDPNQYIWRRRIQQYGPRLDKPYPFYDWVDQALADLKQRGQAAVELRTALTQSERAAPRPKRTAGKRSAGATSPGATPADADTAAATLGLHGPDDEARITPAPLDWFAVDSAVAWDTSSGQPVAQVHLTWTPKPGVHWNNEVDAMDVWIGWPALADDWSVEPRRHSLALPAAPLSHETRRLDFELRLPAATTEPSELAGYALLYACDEADGTCLYLRQDFRLTIPAP